MIAIRCQKQRNHYESWSVVSCRREAYDPPEVFRQALSMERWSR